MEIPFIQGNRAGSMTLAFNLADLLLLLYIENTLNGIKFISNLEWFRRILVL
jgi:hypothetical protein